MRPTAEAGRGGQRCGRRRRALSAACLLVATLASGLAACTDGDGSSTPTPEPTSEPTTSPTEKVDLTFGVFGSNEEIAGLHAMAKQLRHGQRPRRRDREGLAEARRPAAVDRAGQARARRVPRLAARPALVRRERPDRDPSTPCSTSAASTSATSTPATPSRRSAATTACSACRTASRPRWSSTTRTWSTSTGWRSAGSTSRPTTGGGAGTSSWPRRSSRPVPLREHQGRRDRPDAGRVRAVRLLRRRRPLRRRHRPDLARVQRREHPGRPRDDPHRCSATPS